MDQSAKRTDHAMTAHQRKVAKEMMLDLLGPDAFLRQLAVRVVLEAPGTGVLNLVLAQVIRALAGRARRADG